MWLVVWVLVLIISWSGVSKVAGDCVIKYKDMSNDETEIFQAFQSVSFSVYLLVTVNLSTFDIQGEPHQTPSSVMKTDFVPLSLLQVEPHKIWIHLGSAGETFMYNSEVCFVSQGTEAKSGLCSRSCRETGFTRGDIAPLAHPVSADFFPVFLYCKITTLILFVFI